MLEEVKLKLFNDPGEEDVEDVVHSDSVSHVDYYSTTSSKMSTASRRIEFKRKRLEMKARHDLELAIAEAEARFLIEQANLEAEEELTSLSGHGSWTTTSRRDRHNNTTKRRNIHFKQSSYLLNPCVALVENNAGLSGRVPVVQGSSRLGLTVPDDKANALNRGRTGETLNPHVRASLSTVSRL